MSLITRNWINSASVYRGGLIFLCCLFTPLLAHAAIEVPANMIVVGTIYPSETVSPALNDQVYIVTASSGKTQGIGTVIDDAGTYAVDLSKNTDFNGTIMSARIKHGGITYQLLDGADSVEFPFSGGLFPVRITLALTIGEKISGSNTSAAPDNDAADAPATDTEPTFDTTYDVDGDSKLTQKDIDFVKDVVAGDKQASTSADVNQDGIVNTRDIINIIKALNEHTRRY